MSCFAANKMLEHNAKLYKYLLPGRTEARGQRQFELLLIYCTKRSRELSNHRMVDVGMDIWRLSALSP